MSGLGSKNSLYGDAGTQQVEICRKALKLLTMAGRTLGSEFSQETWITLLKITLGASDFLLREPSYRDAHSPRGAISPGVAASMEAAMMADGLCENMIRVLFELWLRSKLTNSDMWARLKVEKKKKCFAGFLTLNNTKGVLSKLDSPRRGRPPVERDRSRALAARHPLPVRAQRGLRQRQHCRRRVQRDD